MEQPPLHGLRTVEAADARAAELKGDVAVIPPGPYCYRPKGRGYHGEDGRFVYPIDPCPYWAMAEDKPYQANGYCAFLKAGDWMEKGTWFLFDQVKECGVNNDVEFDEGVFFDDGSDRESTDIEASE